MSTAEQEGKYSELLNSSGAEVRPIFFSSEILEVLRRNPNWQVHSHKLVGDGSYVQQYLQARGPHEEPAIMVLLVHLTMLSTKDQGLFSQFELPTGRISADSARAVIFGDWPASDTFAVALGNTLKEINELCKPHRLFREDDHVNIADLNLLLPIPHNSRNAFHESVCELYKILVDEMDPGLFDDAKIPKEDNDGKPIGQIKRLRMYLTNKGITEAKIREITYPLEKARKIRGTRSHTLVRSDASDRDYLHEQDQLFRMAVYSLRILCNELGRVLLGKTWKPPDSITRPVRSLHVQLLR